ncbi:MAG TPA: CopG family transcriptional regulator [Lachnospiraceae bacterium]|jgi:Leu/Phe-tRNA-protein transferase|nr:CopG family transcriptional regulator [Lachnospiraceae bacterium]
MSPRPKSDKSKHHRFELRLDDEMDKMLNECSKKLETSKTEVINKGIKMVKSELDKK